MAAVQPARVTIICFGEALWDILPRGIFLGGAPLNVAYHLSRLGVQARPVSAVGRDFLGDEVRRRIGEWGIDGRAVAARMRWPTGTVRATVDARGVPTFTIARDVAWDGIPFPRSLGPQVAPAAVVYGSLALRAEPNRRTLARLFRAHPTATRVLDLNLRPPFVRRDAVEFALRHAQLLKLNDEELSRLAGRRARMPAQLRAAAQRVATRWHIPEICVTAGPRGAGYWSAAGWLWEAARPVAVRDTIGAGDAFLAGFLAARLDRRATPRVALAAACRLGEFVAARDGATPPYRGTATGQPV